MAKGPERVDCMAEENNNLDPEQAKRKEEAQRRNQEILEAMLRGGSGDDPKEEPASDDASSEPAPTAQPPPAEEKTKEQLAAEAQKRNEEALRSLLNGEGSADDGETGEKAPSAIPPAEDPADANLSSTLNQDAIDQMFNDASDTPAENQAVDQDAIDAMLAARDEADTEDPAEPADGSAEASAEEPAEDTASQAVDQDAIDAMLAARDEADTEDASESAEEPTEDAAVDQAVDQDAIDAMLAARDEADTEDASESAEEPTEDAAVDQAVDQDAIDAMLAARDESGADDAAEPADESAEASAEQPAEDEPLDQDAIDAMLAQAEPKHDSEPVMDQDAIDAMMAAKESNDPDETAPQAQAAQDDKTAQDASDDQAVPADGKMVIDGIEIDDDMAARIRKVQDLVDRDPMDQSGVDDFDEEAWALAAMLKEEEERKAKAAAEGAEEADAPAPETPEPAEDKVEQPVMAMVPVGAGASGGGLRSRWIPIILVINTLVICAVAAMVVLALRGSPEPVMAHAVDAANKDEPHPAMANPPRMDMDEATLSASWRSAERAFAEGHYAKAAGQYRLLLAAVDYRPADQDIADFFRLRLGDCQMQLAMPADAAKTLMPVTEATSPLLRALTHYKIAQIHLADKRYMNARKHVYQALAALGEFRRPLPLESDCEFLLGRILTEQALALHNTRITVPWYSPDELDPFLGRNPFELRRLLSDGVDHQRSGILVPQIERAEVAGRRWKVVCNRTPLDELLHRFADTTGTDVRIDQVDQRSRSRVTTLAAREATANQMFEMACGVNGLIARFTGNEVIVRDPLAMTSLNDQRDLLTDEAISVWRRVFVHFPDDERLPTGQYALAAIYDSHADKMNALKTYQLVARRFPRSDAAPMALMHAATLKIDLRDYKGARTDLLDLLDTYPDQPDNDLVALRLAQVDMQTGHTDEALELFGNLYHRNISQESQLASALGAAECSIAKENWSDARKWFARYLALAGTDRPEELSKAYRLLGQTNEALNEPRKALLAYSRSMTLATDIEGQADAALRMVRMQIDREHFPAAVGTLSRLDPEKLGDDQLFSYLTLRCELMRKMGLPDAAGELANKYATRFRDRQRRARLTYEVGRSHADAHRWLLAQRKLAEARAELGDHPLSSQAGVELARACLEVGQADQAVMVLRDVLKEDLDSELKNQALQQLGSAYVLLGKHDKAAEAFAGMVKRAPAPTQPADGDSGGGQ